MKKLATLLLPLALAACGGLNKNTVSYQMAQYDAAQYYVVVGDAATKKAAGAAATANMQQEILAHTPQAGQNVVADLMANAKVEKVWRDKSTEAKH